MSSPAATKPRKKTDAHYVEYNTYIEQQVEKTRRAVRLVDLTQAMLVMAIGLVALLLTATVLEHWILPGGLGTLGRSALFLAIVGCGGFYLVRRVWPLIAQPINPAYAAQAIERENPTLKNSLLNFLLFRREKKTMPPAVFDALEEQAARRLSQTSVEDSVDRTALIKLGYVLLAIVAAATLYAMIAPKSSFATAARVLMPWANIAPPSRVVISRVEPGDVEIVQGDSVEISATVTGLSSDEEVELTYFTVGDDGFRGDERRTTMQSADDAGKFVTKLPPSGTEIDEGIDQSLRYRIVAGDGRSVDYQITVLTAPAIRVRRVYYDFPEYTEYINHNEVNRGDIRAIEGTKVTIFAEANDDIESAYLDLAADGRNDERMRVSGTEAQVGYNLKLEGQRNATRKTTYMLRFTSTAGLTNSEPPQHSIEIVPDYAPEIEVLEPRQRTIDVDINDAVSISVDGKDPDFALAGVKLHFAKEDGSDVHTEPLLATPRPGNFNRSWEFAPGEYDLQPGDIVEYWAEATDNRAPQANRTESDRKELRIVGREENNQQGEDQREGENPKGKSDSADGNEGENGEAGEQGESGEAGEKGEQGSDGEQGESGENGEGENPNSSNNGGENQQDGPQSEGSEGGNAGQQNGPGENTQPGEAGGQDGEQNAEGMRQGAEGEQDEQQNPQDQPGGESASTGGEQQQNRAPGGSQDGANQTQDGEQSASQRSEQGEGGESNNSKPVANDGSNDGEAFDKIQRRLNKQEREKSTRQQKEGGGDPSTAGTDEGAPKEDPKENPEESQEKDSAGESASADGEKDPQESGTPGAGEEGQPQGAPDAQRELQQRDKRPDTSEPESNTDKTEPPTPGHSKKESDSRGEQGGDRTGGGEEGGGQRAPRKGTGSDGQNQAADKGAGQSADQGPGEKGERGGQGEQADKKTGEAGNQKGEGSTEQPGESGEPASADDQRNAEGQGASQDATENQTPSNDQTQGGDDTGNQQTPPQDQQPFDATGQPGGNDGSAEGAPQRNFDATLAERDQANLEYARKQTELMLDNLENQLDQGDVDQELLDDLGWSEDDMRRFVDRWNKLRADASRPDNATAQEELDARLRNLGPSLGSPSGKVVRKQDSFRDLREGYQNKVPLKYRDRLKAYTEGVSKTQKE